MANSNKDRPYRSLVPPWDAQPDQTLLDTRIFRVSQHVARSRLRDRQAPFFVLHTADWVNVIARTAGGEVVLVEQFRHGSGTVTVEIPGGMVDAGEDPLAAGLRELAEETGYRPGANARARIIGSVLPNPAIQDNCCFTVLVDGVVAGPDDPDPNEELGVRLVSQQDLSGLVRDGIIRHALVIAALHHLTLLPTEPPT